jgi:predicted glutamine amidotransferase
VCDRKSRAGTLIVSEPLDDGRDDWSAVPPQSFVTLGSEGLSIAPFQLDAAA